MADIKNIIDNLQTLNKSHSFSFKLPHSKLDVTATPLQARHTTMIDSSLIAGSSDNSYGIKFGELMKTVFADILQLPSGKTLQDFGVYDFNYIILKLREQLSKEHNIGSEDDVRMVSIQDIIKKMEDNHKFKDTATFKNDDYTIKIKLPSFGKNVRYDNIISSLLVDVNESNKNESLERITTESFLYVLIRFIESIEIVVENEKSLISLKELSPREQRDVMMLLPTEVYRELFSIIQQLSEPITKTLETEYDEALPIDQTLFINI